MLQQQKLRPLAEGALLAAITAVFGMMSLLFPLTSFFADFLWGIPIIIVFLRHDRRIGFMSLAVAGILTLMFTEPVMAGLLFLQLAPVAVTFGIMFKKRVSPGRILLTGVAVTVIAEAVVFGLFLYMQPAAFTLVEEINRQSRELFEFYKKTGMLSFYAKQGLDEAALKEIFESSVRLTKLLIPGFFVLVAAIKAALTYFVATRVIERLGFGNFRLPAFREWHLPWYASWVVISGLLLTLVGDHYRIPVLATVGKNIVFICAPIFFIIGLAVGVYFFRRWTMPGWLKTLFIIVAVINYIGTVLLLTVIGFFDPLVAFRARSKAQDSQGGS